ncbi:recombination initiation defects 3 [Tanacetum coccineum]
MSSTFRHSQSQSQSQSQQQQRSQRSFSQGISSQQNAGFSQFSQNSQDETLSNGQTIPEFRLMCHVYGSPYPALAGLGIVVVVVVMYMVVRSIIPIISQERENSVKRFPCLPPVNHTREESQMAISRYSKGLIPKWGSGVSEQRCQMSEEVGHRIGTIESLLSRFGLMLESLQTDIMQVNRGTKELAIDMESIRQKLIAHDNSLQTINKGQEDVKSTLNGELKSISDKLNQDTCHLNSNEISILLSTLQENIKVFVLNLHNDLYKSFTNEMQALGCKLKALDRKNPRPTVLPSRAVNYGANLPHQDGPAYFPVVAILSLGSPVVMDFTPHAKLVGTASNIEDTGSIEGTDDEKLPDHHPFSIALMPRSLLIFKDLAYSEYLHGIKDCEIQQYDTAVNAADVLRQQSVVEEHDEDLKAIHRSTTRVSLTCRVVSKVHKNLFRF